MLRQRQISVLLEEEAVSLCLVDSAVPQIGTGQEDTTQRRAEPLGHEAARHGAISNTLPFSGYCTCKNGAEFGTDLGEPRVLDKSFDFLQALKYVRNMKSSLHPLPV